MSKQDTNIVIIIGRLTKDPEKSTLPTGTEKCELSLAVNESYSGKEWCNFFDVTTFGKVAANCANYLSKGSLICVSGKLKQDRWEKGGRKNYRVSIIANDVQFLQSAKNTQSQDNEFGDEVVPF